MAHRLKFTANLPVRFPTLHCTHWVTGMAKQLIYTADDGFADALIRSLRREGHFCKVVEDEETDLREVRGQGYSLILLDDAPALPSVNDLRNRSAMAILLLVESARLLNQPTPIEADDAIVKPVRE